MEVSLSLPVLIITISGFAGLAAIVLGWNAIGRWAWLSSRTQRRILEAETLDEQHESALRLPSNTLERKLVEANINLTVMQLRLGSLGLGLAAALFSWFFFIPGLPALMIGGMLAYAPFAYLNERAFSRGLRIDEHLPLALSRIAAGLQAGRGLDEVLETTGNSLPEGSPLTGELVRAAQDIRTGSAMEAMSKMADRSSSPSLANVAMLLESYLRAGGGQYASVVSEAAVQIQRVISVRNHARAKAAQALQAARLIPLIMGGVLVMMSQDPATAESFRSIPVQIAIALAMGLMLTGFLMMRREIRRVV